MKRMSDKARKRYHEAKPVREALRSDVGGRCEVTGRITHDLDVHEIARGVHRQKALDKRFALLVVCRRAHEELGFASKWPEARQLAVLAESRLYDFDLAAYLQLTSPNAPNRITLDEVAEFLRPDLIGLPAVAYRMRVSRGTVQSWVDSGKLPASEITSSNAAVTRLKVNPYDLLVFAQGLKSSV